MPLRPSAVAHPIRRAVALLAVTATFALAGCATPERIHPGASQAEVVSTLGAPDATHPLPDGSVNLEYTSQPMGQTAWMVNVADGRVRDVRQVLTMEEFGTVRIGKDRMADLDARFGRRVEEQRLALPGRTVWSWRMKQDGVWPIWMNAQFDADGVVRELFPTPDPATLRGGDKE